MLAKNGLWRSQSLKSRITENEATDSVLRWEKHRRWLNLRLTLYTVPNLILLGAYSAFDSCGFGDEILFSLNSAAHQIIVLSAPSLSTEPSPMIEPEAIPNEPPYCRDPWVTAPTRLSTNRWFAAWPCFPDSNFSIFLRLYRSCGASRPHHFKNWQIRYSNGLIF